MKAMFFVHLSFQNDFFLHNSSQDLGGISTLHAMNFGPLSLVIDRRFEHSDHKIKELGKGNNGK